MISNEIPNFTPQRTRKIRKTKPKVNRRKEITKIRAEIETRKIIEKNQGNQELGFF